MKTICIFLLLTAWMVAAPGARAASFDEANAAFAAGKYHESTAAYLDVLKESGYSAPLLFDLGNSYYREGNYPQAVLAYRRALRLAPGDGDIVANLQAAERQAGLTLEKEPRADKIAHLLSANGWAWLACAGWTALCIALLARAAGVARSAFKLAAFASFLVMALAIGAIVLDAQTLNEAVVIDKNPQVLISPFPSAKLLFTPLPGQTVRVGQPHNDFVWVSDDAGHSGWMPKAQLATVVPSA